MNKDLSDFQIQYIKGVGPQRARILSRLGIKTFKDAFYYLPYRYEDRSNIRKISDLRYGNVETISGKVVSAEVIRLPGKKLKIFELIINDGSGLLKGKWFNQPFMKKNFKIGQEVILCGTVKRNPYWGIGFEMDNPEYEILNNTVETPNMNRFQQSRDDSLLHTNRAVPDFKEPSA